MRQLKTLAILVLVGGLLAACSQPGTNNLMPQTDVFLGDYVWEDVNQNGVQDEVSTGVPGVQVDLYVDKGGFVFEHLDTKVTDANGLYLFGPMLARCYYLVFHLPAGYQFTSQNAGQATSDASSSPDWGSNDIGDDSDVDPATGQTSYVCLDGGENDLRWDAGMFTTQKVGGDGCTPGFWKNWTGLKSQPNAWLATGYDQSADFDTTFGVDLFDPDITLLDAIGAKGGGVNKLARHGTAALLDAAHPSVDYPYTVAEVIAAVQAGDADSLATANELGCPLSQNDF